MNKVILTGRLTKDPEIRWSNETAIANMTLAVDRPQNKNGENRADFPRIVVFGRQAENCQKYLSKGRLVAIDGRIQTGKYEKDGMTIYTTDVVADRVEFIGERGERQERDVQGAGFGGGDEFDIPCSRG